MSFSLEHFCEPLMGDSSYFSKKMFGGLAIYFRELMCFCITESPGEREYRGKKYSFDIWNGVLICTSREHHASLKKDWPELIDHPVLGKWLFLPMHSEKFETSYEEIINAVLKKDIRIGIVPGVKKRKAAKKSATKKK